MKVAFIADSLSPRGGATGIGVELVKMLYARQVAVTILIGEEAPSPNSYRTLVSLNQKPLLRSNGPATILRGICNFAARDAVAAFIAKYDTPDTIYIVNSWFQILSPSTFAPLSKVSRRVLVFAHDFFLTCPNGAYFDFKRDTVCNLSPLSRACVVTNCDKRNYMHKLWRVAVSGSRRLSWPIDRNGSKIVVVHDGMVEHFVKAGIPRGSICVIRNPSIPYTAEHIHAEANKEILYVGSLTAQKGFDLLVAVARDREWTINAFGDGDLRSLAGSAPMNLKVYGYQPHSVIQQAAERSRFLVMPSRQRETFGLAAVEALGSGLPVVVTDQALISQDVRKYECGLVIPSASGDHLIEAFDKMFSDDDLVATFSRNGLRALSNISPTYPVWGDEIIELCRSMLQNADR